jgi:hypothetical protein
VVVVVVVVVVTMTKMMIMKIGPSGTKMTMISIRYHFVPHLVINHCEMDKCLLLHTNFLCYFLVHLCLKK